MTVYVDDYRPRGPKRIPSAHLVTDGPEDELHDFAYRIGLRREWAQYHRHFHYDIIAKRFYHRALHLGAKPVTSREASRIARDMEPIPYGVDPEPIWRAQWVAFMEVADGATH